MDVRILCGIVLVGGLLSASQGKAQVEKKESPASSAWRSVAEEPLVKAKSPSNSLASSTSEVGGHRQPAPVVEGYDSEGMIQRMPAAEVYSGKDVQERSRLRQYPGGRDEQDLKVQVVLQTPTRTLDGSNLSEGGEVNENPTEYRPE